MRHKKRADSDPFGDEVVYAWSQTTLAQREMCMEDWEHGRRKYHRDVATLLWLDSDALLLACFLEFGHPSVCNPNGTPMGCHYGKLRDRMLAFLLVDNSSKTVDNSPNPVDKSVENSVDKCLFYPQEPGFPQGMWMDSADLSTYPHFIHSVPVDKMY